MSSLPHDRPGRQPGDGRETPAPTRRIPASAIIRHMPLSLPFAGFDPDRGASDDDDADEPGDVDATPLAPRGDDYDYPEMPPECVGVAVPIPRPDMTPTVPLVIRAPRGRQPVYPGYTPYVVVMVLDFSEDRDNGEDDITAAVSLVRQRCLNLEDAETVAVLNTHDQSEIRKVLPDATHVIVSDHNGIIVRWYPLD
jgi:hypothetical protein